MYTITVIAFGKACEKIMKKNDQNGNAYDSEYRIVYNKPSEPSNMVPSLIRRLVLNQPTIG